ncbi:hypothetical protein ABID42_000657 [Arcicella rosea]|uniref:hypothetical protein n=1 Tax=Arcicella rosea TaxID=502909 RepID=UPI00345DD01B
MSNFFERRFLIGIPFIIYWNETIDGIIIGNSILLLSSFLYGKLREKDRQTYQKDGMTYLRDGFLILFDGFVNGKDRLAGFLKQKKRLLLSE